MRLSGLSAPSSENHSEAFVELEELFRLYGKQVASWAARMGGPTMDVDDIVQDVFIVAFRRLPELHLDPGIGRWFYRTTMNLVMKGRRRDRLRRWLATLPADFDHRFVRRAPNPVQLLEKQQAIQAVYRVLDSLPEKQRMLLVMFEMEGLTGEEIATVTGTRLPTVWVQLHRARARFLQKLRAFDDDSPHAGGQS